MNYHQLITGIALLVGLCGIAGSRTAVAASVDLASADASAAIVSDRYIVKLDTPGLVDKLAADQRLSKRSVTMAAKLNEPIANAYLKSQREERQQRLQQINQMLGRQPTVTAEYQALMQGFALSISASEAERLRNMPGIGSVVPDRRYQLHTDAGPGWIQAEPVWNSGNRGEGVVIGVLDTGINWDHPAFAERDVDGFIHRNPRTNQFGLCAQATVSCNNKLIGVYDFTDEGSNGRDTDGHGSHVASIAAGNTRDTPIDAVTTTFNSRVSGVAPRANIISYKVCIEDDPATDEDEEGCVGSAIQAALDQAVMDGVDLINYSIGSEERNPWRSSIAGLMRTAREAGVLVVNSAGNSGPGAASLGSPANAPWVLGVANITHDRRFANLVEMMSGGASQAPADLLGLGVSGGFGPARIVHAKDFGNALCGTGTAELQGSCESNTGASNPFAAGTFNGEIVVCDRGIYGRVEKGFNLRAAGAGGYVLANTDDQGESIVGDDHCLPAVHLGDQLGDELRTWLDSGGGHRASIRGQFADRRDAYADRLSGSSSRGPSVLVANQLKPDIAAPGSGILGAGLAISEFKSGTSMASPHVAGMLALVLAENPSLGPDDLHSIAVTTARNEGMRLSDDSSPAGGFDVGGGRARADLAINAGLSLRTPVGAFRELDGLGVPVVPVEQMNLPAMVNLDCPGQCSFSRVVTDIAGGGNWSVNVEGSLNVSVTPMSFSLAAGASQTINIDVDASGASAIGRRSEAMIVLTSSNSQLAATHLPVIVESSLGSVPTQQLINTQQNQGSQMISFDRLAALPNMSFEVSGLGLEQRRTEQLIADATNADPYDSSQGTLTELIQIAAGSALTVETVPGNNGDLDLFVGRDANNDGLPERSEELCRSTSPNAGERCQLDALSPGNYWLVVQNWTSSSAGAIDQVAVRFSQIPASGDQLLATGPRVSASANENIQVRLSWDNPQMRAGQRWHGLLRPSVVGANPDLLDSVPVVIERQGRVSQTAGSAVLDRLQPLLLLDSEPTTVELEPGEGHGRLFIDLPEHTASVRVTVNADAQIEFLSVVTPLDYAAPDVPMVDIIGLATTAGTSLQQNIMTDGAAARLYLVPINQGADPVTVRVSAELEPLQDSISSPVFIEPTQGLYYNPSRSGAGINLNLTETDFALQWYTYQEDGTPVWYLAQNAITSRRGDRWQADLGFFNYDGEVATFHDVGEIVLTMLSADDFVMSYRLHGESGSEPYTSLNPSQVCSGQAVEQTGVWFLPDRPGFGYSVLALPDQQVQIAYLYDAQGFPRWALGQGAHGSELAMDQYGGFCPSCATVAVTRQPVGANQLSFASISEGTAMTDLRFELPLRGVWNETGETVNLTPSTACSN